MDGCVVCSGPQASLGGKGNIKAHVCKFTSGVHLVDKPNGMAYSASLVPSEHYILEVQAGAVVDIIRNFANGLPEARAQAGL